MGLRVAVVLVAVLAGGCGRGSDPPAADTDPSYTPADRVPVALVQDFAYVSNRARAEGLVKHQRQDHCRQELERVRCRELADGWDCAWRADGIDGVTRLQQRYPNGIPVAC